MGKNLEQLKQAVAEQMEYERSEFHHVHDDSGRRKSIDRIMQMLNSESDVGSDDDSSDAVLYPVGRVCTLEEAIAGHVLDLTQKVIVALGIAVEMGKNVHHGVDLRPSDIILDEQRRPVLKSGIRERQDSNKMHTFACTMYEMMTNRKPSKSELRFPVEFSPDLKKIIEKTFKGEYETFKDIADNIMKKLPLINVTTKEVRKYYNEVKAPTSRIVVSVAEIQGMIPDRCDILVEQHNQMVDNIDFSEYRIVVPSRSEFLSIFED